MYPSFCFKFCSYISAYREPPVLAEGNSRRQKDGPMYRSYQVGILIMKLAHFHHLAATWHAEVLPSPTSQNLFMFHFDSQNKPKHSGATFSTIVEEPLLFQ
jgi:hypothetical protein